MRKSCLCPICRTSVEPGERAFPFCSARCRLIDLGQWLGGSYVIPGRKQDTDGSSGPGPGQGNSNFGDDK